MHRTIGAEAVAAIIRGALEAIVVADDHGLVIEFNPAAERMFGWSRHEALGRPVETLIVPEALRARHAQGMERMRAGGPPRMTEREVEITALRRCGAEFPCALSVRRIETSERVLFAASIRDLSELEAERKSRREVEAMLRAVFDDQTEVIFRYDADRRIVFYNLAACRLYGVTPTEMIGRHFLGDIDQRFHARLTADLDALTVEAPTVQATDPKQMPNGETRWIDWRNRALFDEAGRLTGYQAVGRDVTEQHLARMALAASEARFAAFMRNAPVGMYVKDAEGRYVAVNPQMERVLGRPAAEVVGRTAADFVPAELLPVIEEADAAVRATGLPSAVEERIEGAGDYEWTLVVRFPIEAADDGPPQIGGFDIDISAMKRAQLELERAREALHRTEKLRALGHFAAGIAHELNNPLAIIAGQAELLAEDVGDGPLNARAGMIRRAAQRCSGIVRNALAMIRSAPERRVVDLNAAVLGAVEIAAHGPGRVPRIETSLADPSPLASCDPDQMHQVILNLLVNAREALAAEAETGRISIATGRSREADAVWIEVEDSGPGVPEALRDRVFEAYFTTKPVGTGIGLAFCRAIVDGCGGAIDLLPSPGGARFRILLPAAAPEATPIEPAHEREGPASGRVLVLDDDAEVAASLAETLRRAGYETTVALSGREAIARMRREPFDLVLLDIAMDEPDGLGVYAWMAAERPAIAARAVFITGASLDPTAAEAARATGRPVIDKPFQARDLRLLRSMDR